VDCAIAGVPKSETATPIAAITRIAIIGSDAGVTSTDWEASAIPWGSFVSD
jgi:hypothetical protein